MCHFIIRCTSWFSVVSMFSTVGTRNSELLLEQFCVSLVHVGHSTATWIVTSQYSHSHVENVLYYFLCVVCVFFPRAPDYLLLTIYTQCVILFLLSIYLCVDDHVLPASVHQSNFGNNQNKECFFNSRRVTQIQERKTSRSFEVYITS